MPECVTCVSLHGSPGCPASSITAGGDPICIFCVDQLLCPVQKRMLANARSPLHSPKRFAIAHLLQGEKIPRAQAQDAREAAVRAKPKTNGHDPTPTRNAISPHNGAARNLQMRALRAAAAQPAKPKTNGHAARSLGAAASISKPNGHSGADKSVLSAGSGTRGVAHNGAHDVTTDQARNSKALNSQEEKKMATATPATSATSTSNTPIVRTCKIPGCKDQLGSQNQSGLCRRHRSHTAAAVSPAKPKTIGHAHGNGHHAAKSNGSGKTNGHEDRLIARRMKALLDCVELPIDVVLQEIIPEPDKKAFVESWLLARAGAA